MENEENNIFKFIGRKWTIFLLNRLKESNKSYNSAVTLYFKARAKITCTYSDSNRQDAKAQRFLASWRFEFAGRLCLKNVSSNCSNSPVRF